MSVSIRLKRFGSKKRPYYRIVVMDSHDAPSGRTIDEVGFYHPVEAEGKQISLDAEKVKSWLAKGAQPTATVKQILNKQGVQIIRTTQE